VDVGDAPVVADDLDLGGARLQAGQVISGVSRRRGENGGRNQGQNTDGQTHTTPPEPFVGLDDRQV
jgi:hypothetical protein